MNATLTLDQASDASFTNLDEVSGKVVLRCSKSTTISSILVKLEGESRTRLMSTTAAVNERPKPQLEYHKVLYKVAMVFPDAQILEGREQTTSKGNYTLQAGTHEWPWTFKIPFNNACANERGQMPTISIAGGLEIAKAPTRHVKKTLPPTLSGFPGQAEVRYYVKVTVDRQSFFKENPRAFLPFNFFPIEPPRPPSTGDEAFARQKYTFAASDNVAKGKSKLKELFGAQSKDSPSAADAHFSVDARLPSPSILACNGIVPLRLIVKKLSDYDGILYLQSLQVSLVGSTRIRAHNVFRNESTSWIITSTSNMNVPLGRIGDAVNTETIIDDRMWRGHPLPNTVAPTFETCNIIRTYHLDIRIQLSHGALHGGAKVRKGHIRAIV